MDVKGIVRVIFLMLVQVYRNFILCGLMVFVACEAANNLTLSVLTHHFIFKLEAFEE